ncbi:MULTISPECIES: thiamine phosphate synthase [Flavobacterium]|uniref:Thiamine phosphate synthase n=1 Tax=Flavobacterium gawalongense TaxID=2594432 RepID=A0A553BX93_9FLAO|nr:thiamine phosphate synthase [Flavobacterium gawalongense]TRX12795.1 thiamine phosphate synthase [Flavobacterium gawalongense]TRX13140.1 thiamine phosphate synthase [Flavobacterium gawalongense]TRX30798.1 thiamine phosphate synthase [Flavobacterium gawalongense]
MILISNPIAITNEINTIHALFENGMELFHIRKSEFTEFEMEVFVSAIGLEFRNQLSLHSHHHLAKEFGIHRIHFTEKMRTETSEESLKKWKEKGFKLSTSIHCMADFEKLSDAFDYAFFGPVFESISKPNYASNLDFRMELKQRKNNKTALVALGGITSERIKAALEYGFDDVALLGTIWNSSNTIENYKLCQQIVHLY